MNNIHTTFSEYLRQNDSRYTDQKRQIVERISDTKHHFEVDDFLNKMRNDGIKFSRATVYRTIKQLFVAGLIQKIRTKDGKVFYEQNFNQHHHDHLICNQCGVLFEIKEPHLNEYIKGYCDSIKFKLEYRSIHIYGICINCQS